MNKTILAAVVSTVLSASAFAQGSGSVNPYTGVTQQQELDAKNLNELKLELEITEQNLKLQRLSLEELKLQAEEQKIRNEMAPPPPPPRPPAPKVEAPKETSKKASFIVAPTPGLNEKPELIGIIEVDGTKVAMIQHNGRSLRATTGSVVAGKEVKAITHTQVLWGTEYIELPAQSGVPTVVLTDLSTPQQAPAAAQTTRVPVQTVSTSRYGSPLQVMQPGAASLPPPPPSMR